MKTSALICPTCNSKLWYAISLSIELPRQIAPFNLFGLSPSWPKECQAGFGFEEIKTLINDMCPLSQCSWR